MRKGASQMIKEYLTRHDITKTKLAYLLSESVQNLSKKLKKADLDTHYIAKISDALNHNFFEDLSYEYEQNKLQNDLGVSLLAKDVHSSKEDFIKLYIKMQEQIDYLILNAKKNEMDKALFKKTIEEIKQEKESMVQSLYQQQNDLIDTLQLNEDKVNYNSTAQQEETKKSRKKKQ